MTSSDGVEQRDPQPNPITKQNNKEQTQNITQEHKSQTINQEEKHDDNVTGFSNIAASIERLLKTFEYPTDTNRIIECVQFQSSSPESHKILPILQKIEEKQYGNVFDIIRAAEKVVYNNRRESC